MKRFSTFISLLFCALWITACSACQHAAEAHSANTTSNSIVKAPSQDGVEQQNQVKSMEPLRETTPPIITPSSSSKRVLLVGNSQFSVPRVPEILQALAQSAMLKRRPGPRLTIESATTDGTGLSGNFSKGTSVKKIQQTPYDAIIVHDWFGASYEETMASVEKFIPAAKTHHSEIIVLTTATISNDYPQGFIRNDSIAVRIAKEKRFRAISASRPWMLYWGAEPTRETLLTLYAPDTAHPGPRGGYLYALMIYTTLTGDTPIGLTYDIPGMKLSSEEAAALQNAAWKAHQSFVEDTK